MSMGRGGKEKRSRPSPTEGNTDREGGGGGLPESVDGPGEVVVGRCPLILGLRGSWVVLGCLCPPLLYHWNRRVGRGSMAAGVWGQDGILWVEPQIPSQHTHTPSWNCGFWRNRGMHPASWGV